MSHYNPSKSDHFLFYAEDLSVNTITLPIEEFKHIHTVLRIQNDAFLFLTDGKGTYAKGVIDEDSGKNITITIIQKEWYYHTGPQITVLVGLPERDAFETILTHVPALGVHTIIPLHTEYCQKPWWKYNWKKYSKRFTQKMIAALKQSRNLYLPQLLAPVKIDTILDTSTEIQLVADNTGVPLHTVLSPPAIPQSITIAVGPPGGFSEKEITQLRQHHFQCITLAPARLRTELATVTFLSQISGYVV